MEPRIPGRATVVTLIAIALALLTASGCGWQLRGSNIIPEGVDSLYVTSRDPNSNLARELARVLKSADIAVPESAADADYALIIVRERSLVRVASVNEAARASEQELIEEIDFLVKDNAGRTEIERTKITVQRILNYDENNVLATQDERELIRTEMRRDIINQILNQLRQLDAPANAAAP